MFGENYKWNYDYVRLAYDSGFAFEKSRGSGFDKNKISSIDVDRLIRERDVASVESFIPCINQFVLDPEQAAILDEHFVKVFRLSQLTIEYLLFCKKYLDNTLNQVKEEIIKTKEENKELSLFVEDLKQHISVLMKDLKEKSVVASFKCQHCNKIFSTEEFLNSHIKRRHSNEINTPLELETDKLHMEIKELKGRLNSAEKLIQKDQNHLKPVHDTESDYKFSELKKIDELQQKFEDLRVQVQSELKVLQTQYNFQEKYEKLFEKMTLQNSQIQSNKIETGDLGRRRESTTQTEVEAKVQESSNNPEAQVKDKENIADLTNTHKQITEFGEALEVKVTTSLDKIEKQMQSFWNKLHEMEMHKKSHIEQNSDESQVPPPVKPRSKYTVKHSPLNVEKEVDESEVIKEILSPEVKTKKTKKVQKIGENFQGEKIKEKMKHIKDVEIKMNLPSAEDDVEKTSEISLTESESDTVVSSEVSNKEFASKLHLRSSKLPIKDHPLHNYSNKKFEVSPELFEHFKEEVEKIMVNGRLQDLGVSPEWKGLPTRSFQRALEIVNHKASLTKKTYPDYDKIATQIEKDVNRKLKNEITNRNLKNTLKEKPAKQKKKITTISKKGKTPSPQIEIKNRKMYETDSDSEPVNITKVKGDLKQFSAPYSAVIEELKSVTTKFDSSDKSVSDVNSVKEESVKNEETKGVLKNYPPVVSLTKKKVLFNLQNENREKATVSHKETGSTTSITSSVFDGSPKKSKPVKNVKDIEDLSDFDFSDM